ncbi:S8 family peptidase [Bacillus alkalicellulosilyticus]|uniref:S8 family peptidase n=1 Tax=Alkalihalobacterium alkalicellulosilyticum TaxID=1912214 RepID=UPI0009973B29|nr:S8 family serine peptidase [Bacillus alkalicellulosilyticus]
MKSKISILLIMILLFHVIFPLFSYAEEIPNKQIIVTFVEEIDEDLLEDADGEITHTYENVSAVSMTASTSDIKELSQHPNVQSIEPDTVVTISNQVMDWGISKIEAPLAWDHGFTGKGIKIAVIDTGVAINHDDLQISGGVSTVSYTESFDDDNGHGTHVAGIIGAKNNGLGVVGVAPDSEIYAVKVMDDEGSGWVSDMVAGIDWSISNGMDIINLSLGTTTDSPSLKAAVDKAYQHGILVVASAGNDGEGVDTVAYPAKYSSAIAVAATDSMDERGSFSSTGSAVEVAAPGVMVLSTYLNNRYVYMDGTSMAAPYVAGNLALLKERYPTLSNKELRALLINSTVDLGPVGRDHFFGYGLIKAPITEVSTIPSPADEPEYEPAPIFEKPFIEVRVETSKSHYKPSEPIQINTTARDSNRRLLADHPIELVIINPQGTMYMLQGRTNSNGLWNLPFPLPANSPMGTYEVLVNYVETDEYYSNMASTVFTVAKEDTFITLSTNKTQYTLGDSIKVQTVIRNGEGVAIRDQNVEVVITNPKGVKTTVRDKTNSSGQVTVDYQIPKDMSGTYKITARALATNSYNSSNASVSVTASKQRTSSSVTTNTTSYRLDQTMRITHRVVDQNKVAIPNHNVEVVIRNANGKNTTRTGTTDAQGNVVINYKIPTNSPVGDYRITVRALATDSYNGSTATRTVKVNKKKTASTVTSNKSNYKSGETMTITTKVTDHNKKDVKKHKVTVVVTSPNGKKTTLRGETNSKGTLVVKHKLPRNALKGNYKIEVKTPSTSVFTSSSATRTVRVR